MSDDNTQPPTTAELLRRIDHNWTKFNQMLDGLSDKQRTVAHDANGWTVKDHMAHLSAWEQSLLALLAGRNRHASFELGDVNVAGLDIDALNDLIWRKHRDRTYADVLAGFHASHAQVLATLSGLSDADLMQPYSHYQPDSPPPESCPVISWIVGNTFEHYAEHQGWIAEWV